MQDKWKSAMALKDSLGATASSTLASAQDLAMQAGDLAWNAGKAAGGVIGEKAGEAALRVRALSADASIEIKGLGATATSTLTSAQELAAQVADRAWTAGKAAGGVMGEKAGEAALRARALSADASIEIKSMAERIVPLVTETAGQASQHARQLSSKAADGVKVLGEQAATTLRKIDENHEVIAERVENVSMAAGVASGAAAAVAFVAAPSGLAAAGVAIGVTSAPLIVAAVPVLGAVATVAGAVSGGAYFYSKWKRGRKEQETLGKPDKPLDSSATGVGQLTVPQEVQNQAVQDSLPKT